MERLHIEGTRSTPEVELDHLKGVYRIVGDSHPVDANDFYSPILEWLDNTADRFRRGSEVVFQFNYLSSASIKVIQHLIQQFKGPLGTGKLKEIQWLVEVDDEEMIETGEILMQITGVPIRIRSL